MQNVKKPHKYIAAVSGGPDSMAMLDMFHNDIIAVCHVNYHKRDSAKRDETIVKQFCKMHEIPFEKLDATPKLLEQYDTNNFQTSARLLRYDFFAKIAKKHNTFSLLVAHNKDDFVETAIMQQERHSIALFLGIPAQQQFKTLRIERPLLNKRKRDLLKYCDQHNISYGIDETNFEDMYTRNRIRKEILQWNNKEFNFKYLSFKKFNMQNAKLRNKVEQEYEN
jgi:tRNA(Ile)-lysidine synthase